MSADGMVVWAASSCWWLSGQRTLEGARSEEKGEKEKRRIFNIVTKFYSHIAVLSQASAGNNSAE